jgi:hypothetical protein
MPNVKEINIVKPIEHVKIALLAAEPTLRDAILQELESS